MTDNGIKERSFCFIREPELKRCISYDVSYLRIVDVTNVGEQMMLDLEVESPDIPREPLTIVRKVCCGE